MLLKYHLDYNNTGRLASVGRNSTNALLTQYSYNVRSWITGIDSLAYQYRGNMMIRITDNAPAVLRDSGFVYRAPANPEDIAYTYNRNGAIEYNLLNLPQRVTNTMDTAKSVTYSYDSRGGKLHRQTSYMFFATDHLGSVRQVLDGNGAQQEQNDYYPFGMQQRRGGYLQTTTNKYKYKYNGKEQDKFGDFTTLDYGARFYDPAIARWTTVDPKAQKYYSLSPWSYVANNPVNYIDPDGRDVKTCGNCGVDNDTKHIAKRR